MEENTENRNCGCGKMMDSMNCNYTPEGINAAFGYNASSLSNELNCNCSNNTDECCNNRDAVREEMMRQMKCLNSQNIWIHIQVIKKHYVYTENIVINIIR